MVRRHYLLQLGFAAIAVALASAPRPALAAPRSAPAILASSHFGGASVNFAPVVSYGSYGGFYSPGFYAPMLPPAGSYLPPYWWAGPNANTDPRQAGYNPSGGYPWDSVAALLLSTNPPTARVTLNGTYIGTANCLGPIQLPMGEHTIKIEAAGYQPSETVLKVEQSTVQQLNVRLDPVKGTAKLPSQP